MEGVGGKAGRDDKGQPRDLIIYFTKWGEGAIMRKSIAPG